MKKWFGIFVAVSLGLLLGTGIVVGKNTANNTKTGKICEEKGFLSQVVQCNGNDYILYKSTEQETFQVKHTDKDLYQYDTVGTVHLDRVYYVYRFENEGKTVFGIEPAIVEEEEVWNAGMIEAEGTFLAAGNSEKEIFISILGNDGRTVMEYAFDPKAEMKEWRENAAFSLEQGHFAVGGEYREGKLFLAQEDGKVSVLDVVVKEADDATSDSILLEMLEKNMISGAQKDWNRICVKNAMEQYLIPVLLAAAFVVLLLLGGRKENHMIYHLISYSEVICMIGLLAAGIFFANRLTKQEVLETGIETGYILEEMKARQRADGSVEPSVYWKLMSSYENLLYDMVILEPENKEVLMAKNLVPGSNVLKYYGDDIARIIDQVTVGNETAMEQLGNIGRNYVVVSRVFTQIEPQAVLLAVISEEGMGQRIEAAVSVIWNVIWMLMIAVTILHMILFLIFNSKWQKFLEGIQFVALEKQAYADRPTTEDGLHGAWAPLDRIGHNIAKLRYERDLLYRSYYRFVPKGMEQFLEKQEVADIEIGDKNKIHGCLVHFQMENIKAMPDSEYMDVMTESLKQMHQIREKYVGRFISAGGDLLDRKVFFEQKSKEALIFAIEYYQAHKAKEKTKGSNMIMLLHEAEYHYGISGVEDMMTPFIYCKEEEILDTYIDALSKAKVGVALTHQTLSGIGNGFLTRYIGFVSANEMSGSIKLYECLDAYTEDKKKVMKESDVHFQKALKLFYSNDFYLARNSFNEVLKMNPADEIARWYLFHCEYHLNKPEAEVSYGLFEKDIQVQNRYNV